MTELVDSPQASSREPARKEAHGALQDFFHELSRRVAGEVRTDLYSRVLYSTDASIYQIMPYGVLLPRTVEDVQAAVELAHRYQVPLLPRTGGSSLAGQAVNQAVVIDMSRHLDQVLEVNTEESWVRVQPGIVLDQLNRHLSPLGLQFGPDPASSNRAAMGGIVSNNSTGAHSILYGMTADHVLETQVLLSDGSQATFGPLEAGQIEGYAQKTGLEGKVYGQIYAIATRHADTILAGTPRHWRRCGGYNLDRFVPGANFRIPRDPRFNLAKLMSGAEGTLAVLTEIKLNLVPRPAMTAIAVVHFDEFYNALSAVPAMLEVNPSAIELLDNLALRMCRDVPEYARLLTSFVEGAPNCVLITEFYGDSQGELDAKVGALERHLERQGIPGRVVRAMTPELQSNIWKVRKVGLGLLMSIKGDHKPIPFIEDAAVPVDHLADYVTQVEDFCHSLGTDVAYYAHASAGCLHIRPLVNTKTAEEVAKLPQISEFAMSLLTDYGGSLSSEHGDGRARSWLNEKYFGQDLYRLFRQVKGTFDPHNLLNPGNIVDAAPMTENLRYGPEYQTITLHEHLDFSDYLGFNQAVEQCNGAGICRKLTADTMCPSFMVTREEEHTTRGRANALRAALSGLIPHEELTSERMYQVMDLCVECKACKAECPSSVDMARIKFEFMAHYYEVHPLPWRSRLFAEIASISRLASGRIATLANWGLENGALRWGLEKTLGITRERPLPPFARKPFTLWFRENRSTGPEAGGALRPVVLFNDTFNTYNHPEVAQAATEVLEAAGFTVQLPGHHCCGRPMISKGLVSLARQVAQDTVNRLWPYAEQGIPVVGLEPSCLLAIRDDYFALLPDSPRLRSVAEVCFTFEEFIANLAEAGELALTFQSDPRPVLLHGHCHQKSLVGTDPARVTLALAGHPVTEVDSGCCGMAGSFGYEREHLTISQAMAERRLWPAIRSLDEGTLIVASGVSCRQQIADGTGRRALHPAQVLRAALPV